MNRIRGGNESTNATVIELEQQSIDKLARGNTKVMSDHSPLEIAETTNAAVFFRYQDDMVSEILSFLDLRSLLVMCRTTKEAASLLRYDHVFSSMTKTQCAEKCETKKDQNSSLILHKLAQVYGLNGNKEIVPPHICPKQPKPSALRLLRLANGKRCELCHSNIVLPCAWAGVVLPSLSLGKLCCTLCIFDSRRWLLPKQQQHREREHQSTIQRSSMRTKDMNASDFNCSLIG